MTKKKLVVKLSKIFRKEAGKDFAILSTGEKIHNPKYYRKLEQKLAKLQRELSRKQRGSNNRNKARIKLARHHEKIANSRRDFLQKLSTRLIYKNQTICLEYLQTSNMIKNHKLARNPFVFPSFS